MHEFKNETHTHTQLCSVSTSLITQISRPFWHSRLECATYKFKNLSTNIWAMLKCDSRAWIQDWKMSKKFRQIQHSLAPIFGV